MPKQFLVRNVPARTQSWLEQECDRKKVSRNSLILTVLEQAREGGGQIAQRVPEVDEPQAELPGRMFSFIDLFAGIGGLRIGLEAVGGRCVFSSEIDHFAQRTYQAWFGETPAGDIKDFPRGRGIPKHDILTAGFPCQPFSIAGVSKKNSLGREHGFKDKAQGTLFFHLAEIIEEMQPPVLLLENVKNLRSHNKGDTWRTISSRLEELGYVLFDQTIDAADYVPQHRERIFIVGFRRATFGDHPPFRFPDRPEGVAPRVRDILDDEGSVPKKYTLSRDLWRYLQNYAKKHRAKGNGFGFGLADPDGITRTLSARYYKDGSEILIPRGPRKRPRRLTPVEAARLMGFPEPLAQHQVVSDTQAYRQYGNAVVPKVVQAIGAQIVEVLQWQLLRQGEGCLLA